MDALSTLMGSDVKNGVASNPTSGDGFAKLLQHVIANGPMGYSNAMRENLGMNTQKGGVLPTSGMAGANAGTPFWYQPTAGAPDPLQQLLGSIALPETPAAPTTATPAPVVPGALTPAPVATARHPHMEPENGRKMGGGAIYRDHESTGGIGGRQ